MAARRHLIGSIDRALLAVRKTDRERAHLIAYLGLLSHCSLLLLTTYERRIPGVSARLRDYLADRRSDRAGRPAGRQSAHVCPT